MQRADVDRVVLIGFMYSGKSTVGRALARRLGWSFVDFDEVIESQQDRSIAEIFEAGGERSFRRLERELTRRVADQRHVVLAPGGGWVTQPDLVERLEPGSLLVWLNVRPETVHARHRDRGGPVRPLLASERDPLATIRSLLEEREPLYRRADLVVRADDRSPVEIAEEIARAVEARRGEDSDGSG